MHLNISQQMKLGQQMKLAPRMIQSMEILQLPLQALEERIDQELAENVCLERISDNENTPDTESELMRDQANAESNSSELDEKEMVAGSEQNNESDFERLLEMAEQWPEDNVTSATKPSSNRISDDMDRSNDAIANISERQQTLNEYLLEQFHYFNCPAEIKDFGEYLIQNLDHNGRLQSSLPEIVQVYGKHITQEQAEEALQLIQKCDPPGVGARDLKECLLLQLKPDAPFRDVLVTLISSHLEDLGQNRLPVIQRKTGYSIDTIKNAMSYLRYLDPFPGRGFESEPVLKVTPDVFVKLDENGKYVVELENEYTPPLRISRRYAQLLRNKTDDQTKDYIKKKIDAAKWLIEAIEQRHSTLKRVAQAIVDFQTDFLDNGPEHIVPLKMQQIADVVGVHVTTVSRAVDDKWIQTPRGLYPLKRFFGGGTKTSEGEDVAWGIIRLKLKEIIDAEDKNKPLSDDALVEALSKEGYNLARRTVTKYRKAMNIPSSRQRREY
ncbi:RNA polymerase sigma-54 factor [Gimesia alba]|uniref:RNA polymerase sigma-54 factor n=1 Tax=Gimesia alba TaxID=2527973 RepID=A0A517RFL0_9PLAN|nr:RNA polymerase factor sigma-54 [Gimesia alba]QDT42672.1 RNA polymerase sigma-54 factor [Gimesia alba]